MFSNPLSITGSLVTAGGWLYLLFGVGRDAGGFGEVYNLHAGSVANNVILLGYVLVIVGVLGEVGKSVVEARRVLSAVQPSASSESTYTVSTPDQVDFSKLKFGNAFLNS